MLFQRAFSPRRIPLVPVALRNHRLANGLVAMYAPGVSKADLVFRGNAPLTTPTGGPSPVPSQVGNAWSNPNGSTAQLSAPLTARQRAQSYTVIWYGQTPNPGSATDVQSLVVIKDPVTGALPFWLYYGDSGHNNLTVAQNYGSGSDNNFNYFATGFPSTTTMTTNFRHVAATITSGFVGAYYDGASLASAASATGTLNLGTTPTLYIGDSVGNGVGANTAYVMVYNRVLSADEIAEHARAPFIMCKPAGPRLRQGGSAAVVVRGRRPWVLSLGVRT